MKFRYCFLLLVSVWWAMGPAWSQDLSGCWSGGLSDSIQSYSALVLIKQEKEQVSEHTFVTGNHFTATITLMNYKGIADTFHLVGKITMKGILFEEIERHASVYDTMTGTLKKSKMKYEIKDNMESLTGTWEVNESSMPAKVIKLQRCPPPKAFINQYTDAGEGKKKKYKTKVLLTTDSTGRVQEALNRKVKNGTTVRTKNKEFTISIYDNRQQDGDSLTIIFNDKIVLHHQLVKKDPYLMTLELDPSRKKNTLIFYADNLGRIPPNTAVVSIMVNNKVIKELRMSSNLESSDILYLAP